MDFTHWTDVQDFFNSVHDFFQAFVEYFGTGLKNVEAIPEVFENMAEWFTLTFPFLPPFYVQIFIYFALAAMIIRFFRW